jgi:hypothetical protein
VRRCGEASSDYAENSICRALTAQPKSLSQVVFTFRSDDNDFNSVAYVMVSTVDSDLCQTCGDSLAEPITITSLPVQLEGSTVGFSNHHFIGCTAGYALPPTLFNRHTMP